MTLQECAIFFSSNPQFFINYDSFDTRRCHVTGKNKISNALRIGLRYIDGTKCEKQVQRPSKSSDGLRQ